MDQDNLSWQDEHSLPLIPLGHNIGSNASISDVTLDTFEAYPLIGDGLQKGRAATIRPSKYEAHLAGLQTAAHRVEDCLGRGEEHVADEGHDWGQQQVLEGIGKGDDRQLDTTITNHAQVLEYYTQLFGSEPMLIPRLGGSAQEG